jgi:transposase
MRPLGSPAQLEARRLKAWKLLKEGVAPVDVARRLGIDRRSVRRWRAEGERRGRDGLASRPAPGRPSRLTERCREQVVNWLLAGARACGFPTDLWTCPRVAQVIRRRCKVHYHVDHVGRLLRALGFSPQKPERRARERDEDAIRGWVRNEWPRVKKTPRDAGRRLRSSTRAAC